jgi:integrase/recombinase XerD
MRRVHGQSLRTEIVSKTGSLLHLQKVLGHSSLEMSRRYANLMTEDLSKVHEQVSLLSA